MLVWDSISRKLLYHLTFPSAALSRRHAVCCHRVCKSCYMYLRKHWINKTMTLTRWKTPCQWTVSPSCSLLYHKLPTQRLQKVDQINICWINAAKHICTVRLLTITLEWTMSGLLLQYFCSTHESWIQSSKLPCTWFLNLRVDQYLRNRSWIKVS